MIQNYFSALKKKQFNFSLIAALMFANFGFSQNVTVNTESAENIQERIAQNSLVKADNMADLIFETSKIWVSFHNNTGSFDQLLVGYIREGTTGLDWGYDGEVFGGNQFSLYTICEEVNLSIQARPLPFTKLDILPLGYNATSAGSHTITLQNVEGIFTTAQSVYLKDEVAGIFHNLKSGPYTFTSAAGRCQSRFELHFRGDHEKHSNTKIVQDNSDLIVYKNFDDIVLEVTESKILDITVYDMQGRILKSLQNSNTPRATISNLAALNQVLIVKATTAEGKTYTKRIVH